MVSLSIFYSNTKIKVKEKSLQKRFEIFFLYFNFEFLLKKVHITHIYILKL